MKKKQINILQFVLLFLLFTVSASAIELDSLKRNPKYIESIISRSQKIVDKLELKDPSVSINVRNIIANRYFHLNDIYDKRDANVKKIKESSITGAQKNAALIAIDNEKEAALYRSHFAFPSDLSLYLTEKQIEVVKDGITYGVVMVTYNATLDMIPSLKTNEKKQILVWLVEAREFALDAENSNQKHAVFGKYKGRINNYLSGKGYDLTKERTDWAKRLKTKGVKL